MVQVEFVTSDNGSIGINSDGFNYTVDIKEETRKIIDKYLQNSSKAKHSGTVKIKAPMPGMVIKVITEEGSLVKKGDVLLIIEAMKMENAIKAPADGKIKNLKVRSGKIVEKDKLLLEIEG
jgi:biotin carboxyl carrier protein